jgi:hypothetical protein
VNSWQQQAMHVQHNISWLLLLTRARDLSLKQARGI